MSLRFSPFLSCGEVQNSRRECARFETGDAKFAISYMEFSEQTRFTGMRCPNARILPISSGRSALGREFGARLL
jgi:hypothetical protein